MIISCAEVIFVNSKNIYVLRFLIYFGIMKQTSRIVFAYTEMYRDKKLKKWFAILGGKNGTD